MDIRMERVGDKIVAEVHVPRGFLRRERVDEYQGSGLHWWDTHTGAHAPPQVAEMLREAQSDWESRACPIELLTVLQNISTGHWDGDVLTIAVGVYIAHIVEVDGLLYVDLSSPQGRTWRWCLPVEPDLL